MICADVWELFFGKYRQLISFLEHIRKRRRLLLRSVIAMLLAVCIVLPVSAAGTAAFGRHLIAQTVSAVIYANSCYTRLSGSDGVQITVSGSLPENSTVRAYPVTVDGDNVGDAYDISLFDQKGAEDGKYVSSMATYFNVEYDEAICRLPVCTGSLKIRI